MKGQVIGQTPFKGTDLQLVVSPRDLMHSSVNVEHSIGLEPPHLLSD